MNSPANVQAHTGALGIIKDGIANLHAAYFALVMATGIISIACHFFNYPLIALTLFYINIGAYVILCSFSLLRVFFYTQNFLSDFRDTAKSPGFLTLVAGSCILGNQFIFLSSNYYIASFLFYIGVFSWLLLIYALFTVITVSRNKPPLDKAMSGVWLLFIVSTQAVSILAALLAEHLPFTTTHILFFSLMMFLLGCMFYIIIITLIVYRLSFFEIQAETFAPPYWINMGAVAITTLAGSTLMLNSEKWNLLASILPFIKGFTFFFWATATWWIPLIVILGVWRHFIKQMPIKYHPQYWGMVFPLGMYTVCTSRLSQAADIPFLHIIPSAFIYIALFAWGIAFVAMLLSILKNLNPRFFSKNK